MVRRPIEPLLWFAAALVPMIVSQIVRLHQAGPVAWLLWDYGGRIGALSLLASLPSARGIVFQRQKLRVAWWEAALWIAALVLAYVFVEYWISPAIDAAFPGTKLGSYPALPGWLRAFDLVFGLALVAAHEEILFRRFARHAFQPWLGDGGMMIAVTSLAFAAYHWWSGIGNICEAALLGVLLMLAYRRVGALWPVMLAHYLMDVVSFV